MKKFAHKYRSHAQHIDSLSTPSLVAVGFCFAASNLPPDLLKKLSYFIGSGLNDFYDGSFHRFGQAVQIITIHIHCDIIKPKCEEFSFRDPSRSKNCVF